MRRRIIPRAALARARHLGRAEAVCSAGGDSDRKPTEIFAFVSGAFNKAPAGTSRQYGRLFREYSTAVVSPELLAALAQVEGAGNPVARTYWRWQLSWNPLALYQPTSSGVGMFQMTDAAFAEARQFCVHNHIVLQDDCRFGWLYIRAIPSHAIELAAVYLDHNLERIFAGRPTAKPSAEHKRKLASMIHLCGAGAAKAFAQRGFRPVTGERCGEHDCRNLAHPRQSDGTRVPTPYRKSIGRRGLVP